jgi:hypothetical protein
MTGRKYNKKITASYTFPVGQTPTNKYFQQVVAAILAAYKPAQVGIGRGHVEI